MAVIAVFSKASSSNASAGAVTAISLFSEPSVFVGLGGDALVGAAAVIMASGSLFMVGETGVLDVTGVVWTDGT